MKNPLLLAIVAITAILFISHRNVAADDPRPVGAQAEEYVTIIYGGRYESVIIRPGGKAEFPNLAGVNYPDRMNSAQEINYCMYLMIEKCAKEGYTVVDFVNAGYVIMKRRVGA